MPTRGPRPPYVPKPTGAFQNGAGLRWACWATGIGATEWRSDPGKIRRNYNLTGWYAIPVGTGQVIRNESDKPKVFRTFENAARELVKLAGLPEHLKAELRKHKGL